MNTSTNERPGAAMSASEKRELLARLLKQKSEAAIAPLALAQERLWFLDQWEPNTSAYNMRAAVRMQGRLDVAALERSINEIVRRHEPLRTTFALTGGQPVQIIAGQLRIPLPVEDLSGVAAERREEEAMARVMAEIRRPFDLSRGPLLRTLLIRLDAETHILVVTVHHIVSDGWSLGVFVREMSAFYAAFQTGRTPQLPALPIRYRDYAVWQRQRLQGDDLDGLCGYWKKTLGGSLPVLELPTDHPRPAAASFEGASHFLRFSPELTAALKDLSRREGTTFYATLLAAYNTLLYRYTRQDDILVGCPIAGRTRAEVESIIGFFVNTLVLRGDLSGNPTFRDLLGRMKAATQGAYAHQELPFAKLVELLKPERNLSHTPLIQTTFGLENMPMPNLSLPGLKLELLDIDPGTAKLDLTFYMVDRGPSLSGRIEYNTALFDTSTIERLAGHFRKLLEGVAENPGKRLSELPMLTAAERRQVVVEWNATEAPVPAETGLHQLFETQAERFPEMPAVECKGQMLTYRQLNAKANRLARHLRTLGVGPDVLVGLCVERSLDLMVGILGIMKAGGAYVPMDPNYPAERIAGMLDDSRVPVLLTQEALLARLPQHSAQTFCLDADWPALNHHGEENLNVPIDPEQLAYVIYTSGSTGKPKGVMVPHRGLPSLSRAIEQECRTEPGCRSLQFASTSFDASVFEFLQAWSAGGTLCLADPKTCFGEDYIRFLRDNRITHIATVPSALPPLSADETLPDLRCIVVGGETCPAETATRWGEGRLFFGTYGPTEATISATLGLHTPSPLPSPPSGGEGGVRGVPTLGKALPNMQIYILDEHKNPVPVGVTGEMYIGGIGVARGYLHRPELTAERFIADPFSGKPGARLYKTGDLARFLPDGQMEFRGRVDHQVKIRGFRIELGEIEAALGRHPGVREAVVIAREDVPGNKRLAAYIVADSDNTPTLRQLREHLGGQLPEYMVPSAFVFLETMPLSPNGKVDRRALPAPDSTRPEMEREYTAPRNALEAFLQQRWQEKLGIDQIGVHDNFFQLGGDSVIAATLMLKIQETLKERISVASLFQGPTIAELAAAICKQYPETAARIWGVTERAEECPAAPASPARSASTESEMPLKAEPGSPLVAMQPGGSKPPFFCVHPPSGVVFLYAELARRMAPDHPFYAIQGRGLQDGETAHNSVEEMAAWCIEAMRKVQPHGPYYLGGWSGGGTIAVEVAQQLMAAGEEIALLALFDTGVAQSQDSYTRRVQHSAAERVGFLVGMAQNQGLEITPEELTPLNPQEQMDYICAKLDQAGPLAIAAAPHPMGRILRTFESHFPTFLHYVRKPYAGKITLFRASLSLDMSTPTWDPGSSPKLDHGWGRLAKEVEVIKTPGSHRSMVHEPHVVALAEQLKGCIDKAREGCK